MLHKIKKRVEKCLDCNVELRTSSVIMSFPNKSDRLACWGHRDEYWKCLDEAKVESDCDKLRKEYVEHCPAQWVKHFDRKRKYLLFKDKIEKEGYIQAEEAEAS